MKKLFLFAVLGMFLSTTTFAGKYTLNEDALNTAFEQAEDITFTASASPFIASTVLDDEPTKGGFLIRAYFCGMFGLHRSYMGTGGETLWWKYFCIPVANCIAINVDFWGVVFKGDEFWMKYKDNPKFFAWKHEG